MTLRSPKQQPPKSVTNSRKIRNRADQSLAIQPPELPQLKDLRTHRTNALPVVRSSHHQPENIHTPTWNSSGSTASARNNTSHPSGFAQDPHSGVLLSQPLGSTHYLSSRPSNLAIPPQSPTPDSPEYAIRATSESDLLQSPLPSLSGSHTATEFDLRISAEPEPPHDSYFKAQDMRYTTYPNITTKYITDPCSTTLGYMMAPAPYGMEHYGSPHHLDSPSKRNK